jgi:hypothetical protein
MALLPKVKLKTVVSFPATVLDGAGIDVVKQNGTYQFNLDFGDFAPPVGGIADAAHQNALLWNSVDKSYALAPVSLFGGGGGVSEAPNDGVQYGRQSLAWTPIVAGGGGTPSNTNPVMDGIAAPGALTTYSRGDHVHPTDTSRAPLASPAFTGNPTAPTPTVGDNDTSIATTAFVNAQGYGTVAYIDAADALKAPLASPALTGVPTAPTAAPGTGTTQLATTAFVAAAVTGGGAFVDAPNDGSTYGRKNLAWAKSVALAGDTMTGALNLQYSSSNSVSIGLNDTIAGGHNWAIASSGGGPGPAGSLVFYDGTAGGPLFTMLGGSGTATFAGSITAASFNSPTGSVNNLGDVYAVRDATHGVVFFGSGGSQYIYFDGAQFTFTGGPVNAALSATSSAPTPVVGDNSTKIATTAFVRANAAAAALPPRYWQGYQHANNVTSPNTKVDVAAGSARNSTNVQDIANVAGTIDCAVVGANGLDAGALAASKWYYTFAIATAAGVTAFLASLSSTAPTLPATYTVFRRIGAIRTNASAQIMPFKHLNDRWYWVTPPRDVNVASVVLSTNVTVALPSVPAILGVLARISVVAFPSVAVAGTVYIAPSYVPLVYTNGGGMMGYATTAGATLKTEVEVDAASQINYLIYSASGTHTLVIDIVGWIDPL